MNTTCSRKKKPIRYVVDTQSADPPLPCAQYTRVEFLPNPTSDDVLVLMQLSTPEGGVVFPNLDLENVLWTGTTVPTSNDPTLLRIGFGGDPKFDKRVAFNPDDSNATLMARHLGLLHHPAWAKTLEDVRREDRTGRSRPDEIPHVVKLLREILRGREDGIEQIVRFATAAYATEIAHMQRQWDVFVRDMHDEQQCVATFQVFVNREKPLTVDRAKALLADEETREEFCATVEMVCAYERDCLAEAQKAFEDLERRRTSPVISSVLQHGLQIMTIESDNSAMVRVAWKYGASIVIIRRSNGHTAIFTQHQQGLDLTMVDDRIARCSGEEGRWHLHRGTTLLNGSERHPDVLPSELPLARIIQIVFEVHRDGGLKKR